MSYCGMLWQKCRNMLCGAAWHCNTTCLVWKLQAYSLYLITAVPTQCTAAHRCEWNLTVGRVSGWEDSNPSSLLEACMGYSPPLVTWMERVWQSRCLLALCAPHCPHGCCSLSPGTPWTVHNVMPPQDTRMPSEVPMSLYPCMTLMSTHAGWLQWPHSHGLVNFLCFAEASC